MFYKNAQVSLIFYKYPPLTCDFLPQYFSFSSLSFPDKIFQKILCIWHVYFNSHPAHYTFHDCGFLFKSQYSFPTLNPQF